MSQLIPPPETPQEHYDIPDPSKASPLSRFFFLETVFAILLSALLIMGGLMAVSTMVKEGDPDINFAIATIQTNWGGADPETIENQVTDKIEKELKSLKGLKDLSSASFNGSSLIKVEFEAEAPIAESIALVRAEVDEAKPEISNDADEPKVEQVATQGETFGSAGQMALVSLFLIFAVLVIQFSSFTQPFIIMLAIPFAFIGTFLGFFFFQIPISFPAVIGIIALTGIVVNDAIVMIETMNSYRSKGMKVRDAAARGAADRLRPILTTSITTIVGVIPLALSDPTWFPLASAIGFGLVASTLIALLVIPCLYLLLTPNKSVVNVV